MIFNTACFENEPCHREGQGHADESTHPCHRDTVAQGPCELEHSSGESSGSSTSPTDPGTSLQQTQVLHYNRPRYFTTTDPGTSLQQTQVLHYNRPRYFTTTDPGTSLQQTQVLHYNRPRYFTTTDPGTSLQRTQVLHYNRPRYFTTTYPGTSEQRPGEIGGGIIGQLKFGSCQGYPSWKG